MDQSLHDTFAATGDAELSLAPDRRDLRDSMLLSAELVFDGDRTAHAVRIRNLSSGGLMADYNHPVAIGTSVTVDVRGIGPVPGKVAWTAAGRIGIELSRKVNPRAARKPVSAPKPAPAKAKPIKPLLS